jgi:uncharacterized protein (TIRG00374 family)
MARTQGRLVTPVRRLVQLLLVAFVVIYFVLPQIAGARRALNLLAGVNLWLIALGIALEAASILSYANLTRAMIHGQPPPYLTLLRINLATLAVSHVVPGGAAVGGALGFRMLTRFGLSGTDAAFAMAAQGIGSAVVLNLLLWVGLLVSIVGGSYNPLYATAALVGVLLLGAFSAVVVLLMRGERRAAEVMRAVTSRVPFLDEDTVYQLVLRLATRLQTLVADRDRLRRGLLWDLAFWICSAASLWVFLAAFGYRAGLDGLIVAFGLAYVLAAIPITPAGLGVVEATMIALLTFFGADRGVATLGVVSYRLINFWLPIPLGALAYLSLQVEQEIPEGRRRLAERQKAAELRRLAERSLREAEEHRVHLGRREPPPEG